jgi:alpha-ketoglutarate-dependent taurine dioxygenase
MQEPDASFDWISLLVVTTNAGNEFSGMRLEEGQALHRKLASHASRAEFRYLHRWRPFDLVMWDNRALLHRAKSNDMARYRRVFRRTTVAGEGPVVGPFRRVVRGYASGA